MNNEIWKEVEGYNGDYLISNLGKVKSLKHKNPKILIATIDSKGYYKVNLCKNNFVKTHRVHKLLADTFIPNPNNKPTINHINGIKTDNSLKNLEHISFSDNSLHAYKIGLSKVSIKEAIETRKKQIYSKKLDIKFNSCAEAARYIQSNYFKNTNLITIKNAICHITKGLSLNYKYDFGWKIINNK